MTPELISVRPTPDKRQAFAAWAVAQTPKVRTISPVDFAVPGALFTAVPEDVLIGALVDGHRYVSPTEDETGSGRQGAGARLLGCGLCYEEDGQEVHPHPECPVGASGDELLGVARPDEHTGPGQGAVAADGGDSSVSSDPGTGNDFAPLKDAVSGPDDGDQGDTRGRYACGDCARSFRTERGRDSHRRQAHRED